MLQRPRPAPAFKWIGHEYSLNAAVLPTPKGVCEELQGALMDTLFALGRRLYSSMPGIEPSEWSHPIRPSTIMNKDLLRIR